MADYDWFDNEPEAAADKLARQYRPLGFQAIFGESTTMGGGHLRIKYYYCRRGCGTIVWDVPSHIKNVCTEFNPVAGE